MTIEPAYSKVGPKGQIVISKQLRDKYSIEPGKQVEQIETKNGQRRYLQLKRLESNVKSKI